MCRPAPALRRTSGRPDRRQATPFKLSAQSKLFVNLIFGGGELETARCGRFASQTGAFVGQQAAGLPSPRLTELVR